ncbi:MAG: hypothetical protein H0U19_02995 [Acidobacteria bacterium]|nr:hypothetical protein [Acidobacteriota bacterium]
MPRFDGFPYLVTRLMSSLYNITLLPEDAPESTLVRLAQRQLGANKLDTCLVLASDRATFCWADGRIEPTDVPPCGGTLLSRRLALSVDLLRTEDLVQRQEHLDRLVANGRAKGTYFFDNLVKGGRNGTREELERLNGTQAEGLPRGLAKCGQCGDWRGECLDADPTFAGIVMPVHCRCQNHNACARCGGRLYERRLNANFYDPRDRGIWHVPGLAIDHKCRTMVRATR